MASRARQNPISRRRALLVTLPVVVHLMAVAAAAQSRGPASRSQKRAREAEPEIVLGKGAGGLPPAVADMRFAIIAAVETGDIAELKAPIELNELKPEFGAPPGKDWLAHLVSLSGDGMGKDVLALVGRLLDGGWAAVRAGRDIENSRIYVWPQFAEIKLDALTSEQSSELEALAGKEAAERMIATGRYTGWRLSVGADGVWHMLTRIE